MLWDSAEAPEGSDGTLYYLVSDCPAMSESALSGQMWVKEEGQWKEYSGEISY